MTAITSTRRRERPEQVIGLPDEKWGERVTAVLQLEVGADLPRSKVGKALKAEIRETLRQTPG